MTNKVLIVAGMHRSGTSVVSQWLYKCGLHMGEDLLGPGIGNTEGHFEDTDFLSFHEEILRQQQLPESGLIETYPLEISSFDKQRLKNLIEYKNYKNCEWGWKDPRTCLLLQVYEELIPEARYLVVIRDYQSSVSSLINRILKDLDKKERNFIDRYIWKKVRIHFRKKKLYKRFTEHFVKVWITYNKAILHHIHKLPATKYLVIDYKMLEMNDKQVFFHLKEKWNFNLTHFDFKKVYKKKLMNKGKNISRYVKDKSLLNAVRNIENELRAMIY